MVSTSYGQSMNCLRVRHLGLEQCLPTLLVLSASLMLWKWPANLSVILCRVFSTYWMLHLVQVMQQMTLELLHDMFFMQLYSLPVVLLGIMPDLFSVLQSLQVMCLQNGNPLLVGYVPCLFVLPRVAVVGENRCNLSNLLAMIAASIISAERYLPPSLQVGSNFQ